MWRTLTLGSINALLSLSSHAVRIPGLEITPAAMVLIAQGGEGIVWGALFLTLSYMIPQPRRFAYVWLHFPSAILTGWLAIKLQNPYIPILVYEALSLGVGLLMGLSGFYLIFILVNTALNLAIVRVAGFF